MKSKILLAAMVFLACVTGRAQVNSGSDGSDGALDYSSLTNLGYSTNIVINMTDHPTGIYNYTYVNIPTNLTVSFIPNASNSPVVWLVQRDAIISGTVNVSGKDRDGNAGGLGGPGGYAGGVGGSLTASSGYGPGGGPPGENASFGTVGYNSSALTYGNQYLIPLIGGSGGGGIADPGSSADGGGGGGGGAILIAASGIVRIDGSIFSTGAGGYSFQGNGSGGAVRLVASKIDGSGNIYAHGGWNGAGGGGFGRVRFDTYDFEFLGSVDGQYSVGVQTVIIPNASQLPQLTVTSIGGVPVSPSPTGALSTPDAVLSSQQNNPIAIGVSCINLPLNTPITIVVRPVNGNPVSVVGYNNTGTFGSSTATVSLIIPRGGGQVYAMVAASK